MRRDDAGEGAREQAGLAGVRVTVEGEGVRRELVTDASGRYKFEELPAGRYLLGVRLSEYSSPGDADNALPRTYYPGAERAEEAEVVELKAGEEVKGRDLRLPPRRPESSIRVRVVWGDGTPVVKAQVIYRDVTYGEPPINHGETANERGEATLKGYTGSVYRIWASSDRPFSASFRHDPSAERAEPVTLNAASPVETVTVVIRKLK